MMQKMHSVILSHLVLFLKNFLILSLQSGRAGHDRVQSLECCVILEKPSAS